ncbi:unnamed protein product, partial [Amoebophrya sp. A25]|eukprot:GSA25T00026250001.1
MPRSALVGAAILWSSGLFIACSASAFHASGTAAGAPSTTFTAKDEGQDRDPLEQRLASLLRNARSRHIR